MNDSKWFITGASAIGLSHIASNTECQDSFDYRLHNNGWGIAVVADGAGSALNSKKGSEFVVNEAINLFSQYILENIVQKSIVLEAMQWKKISKEILISITEHLKLFAFNNSIEYKTLACTVIVVLFSMEEIFVVHVGDGRACYCDDNNKWKPLLTPYKGEFANETVFLTSDCWLEAVDSYITQENAIGFAIMSDGCEKQSFECNIMDDNNKLHDPNLPFNGFFNPVSETLRSFVQAGKSKDEINSEWETFLKSGANFGTESDDKTMIVGLKILQT